MNENIYQRSERLTIDKIVMNEYPHIMSAEEQMNAKGGGLLTAIVTFAVVKGGPAITAVIKGGSAGGLAKAAKYAMTGAIFLGLSRCVSCNVNLTVDVNELFRDAVDLIQRPNSSGYDYDDGDDDGCCNYDDCDCADDSCYPYP